MTDDRDNMRALLRFAAHRTRDMRPRRTETNRDIRMRFNSVVVTGLLGGEDMIAYYGCDWTLGLDAEVHALDLWGNSMLCLGTLRDWRLP